MATRITETKAEQARSNVGDDLINTTLREVSENLRILAEAQGVHRARLKRAKSDGIDTAELLATLAARKLDPDEVVLKLRTKVRYHNLAGMRITVGGLFDDLDLGADPEPVSDDNRTWAAEDAGYLAGKNNGARDDNPFAVGTETHARWDASYQRGKQALADIEKDGTEKAAPTRRNKARPESSRLN